MSSTAFSGRITTTGTSDAIRLEKALFRAHPEFKQKARVRARYISRGQLLISVIDEAPYTGTDEDDPVLDAFLGLLAEDISIHPNRIVPLTKEIIARAEKLTKNVVVSDEESIPEDVTL